MVEEPLFRKVDCVALRVSELDQAIAFYGVLGHELLWRDAVSAGLRLPNSEAELVLQTERPGPETDLSVEDVGRAVERFVATGGRVVVAPFDIAIGRCAVVADPWDNELVLLDNSKGHVVTDAARYVVAVEPVTSSVTTGRFRARVAVYGVLLDRDRVLLMRRAGSGHRDGELSLPAGHLDGDEDALSALVRELLEELLIEVDRDSCQLATTLHSAAQSPEDDEYLNLFFTVGRWVGSPAIGEPDRCSELVWAARDHLPADVVDYVGVALRALWANERFLSLGWHQ